MITERLGSSEPLLAQPHGEVLGAQVRVALEHLQRLVARHRGDLHHIEALLEEAARGLVPEIMQAQPNDARAPHGRA